MRRSGSLLVCAVLAIVTACGSETSGEFTTEDGETGEYSIDESSGETSMTISTSEGETTLRSGTDVPVDLPSGFDLYPGAEVISNTTVDRGDELGSLVMFQSDDSPEKIASYYKAQAEDAGIEIQIEASINGGQMVGGEGPDGTTFSVNASPAEGRTTAQLVVGRSQDR